MSDIIYVMVTCFNRQSPTVFSRRSFSEGGQPSVAWLLSVAFFGEMNSAAISAYPLCITVCVALFCELNSAAVLA